jgi:hypothetical protein
MGFSIGIEKSLLIMSNERMRNEAMSDSEWLFDFWVWVFIILNSYLITKRA